VKDEEAVRRRLLKKIISEGHQIAPDAFEYLTNLNSPLEVAESLLLDNPSSEIPLVITRSFLRSWIERSVQSQFVELKYTTNLGKEGSISTTLDVESLRIGRSDQYASATITLDLEENEYIPDVEIAPLVRCSKLRILELGGLGLEHIDLEPLKYCPTLEELYISGPDNSRYGPQEPGGFIKKLDLAPLSNCNNLRILVLKRLGLQEINLEPLESCTLLEELHISGPLEFEESRLIRNLDLAPLEKFQKLRIFGLENISLGTIDLSPLRKLTALEEVRITGYSPYPDRTGYPGSKVRDIWLSNIDLNLFSNCSKLRRLYLDFNEFKTIDLSPIVKLSNLETLSFEENRLRTIDLGVLGVLGQKTNVQYCVCDIPDERGKQWPLAITLLRQEEYKKLGGSRGGQDEGDCFDFPIKLTSMQSIESYYNLLKNDGAMWKLTHLVQCIPITIGMPKIGLLDIDSKKFLGGMFELVKEQDDRDLIQDQFIEAICTQIDEGGTTIGINLDDNLPMEIMKRADRILKLRDDEMQEVKVQASGSNVDYTPLWMTANGFRVLGALKQRSKNDEVDVRSILEELGYHLKITDGISTEPSHISEAMKDYIKILGKPIARYGGWWLDSYSILSHFVETN